MSNSDLRELIHIAQALLVALACARERDLDVARRDDGDGGQHGRCAERKVDGWLVAGRGRSRRRHCRRWAGLGHRLERQQQQIKTQSKSK